MGARNEVQPDDTKRDGDDESKRDRPSPVVRTGGTGLTGGRRGGWNSGPHRRGLCCVFHQGNGTDVVFWLGMDYQHNTRTCYGVWTTIAQ
jgi:hypothetical protein